MESEYRDVAYQRRLQEEKEDRLKLAFTLESLRSGDRFAESTQLDDDLIAAIKWQAARSSQCVIGVSLRVASWYLNL